MGTKFKLITITKASATESLAGPPFHDKISARFDLSQATPMMPNYLTYNVIPQLPDGLEALREMVFNLWWTWEPSARRLFRHLDPELWDRTNHNPVRMLQLSRQARLEEVSQDKNFLRELKEVHDSFRRYLARKDTYGKTGHGSVFSKPIAYFSAEFGFHESIPNYSGGLGILSGDHCKSASDLDLNFVAIGLL
ncbi:MAG: DUF3417 domain-containing protein, partial [Chthoniobacterales bacterium]|nr:DUF3417 domain-containing protein [Chthoniobacterales bacterium]